MFAALLVLIVAPLPADPVCGAERASDPYAELTEVLMTRYKDGKAYATNETSPAIFAWSEFPFDDKTFKKFDAALDACLALPQAKIEGYSDVQRALLQRHLWKVFDTTFNWDWWKGDWYWAGRKSFPKTHMGRRRATQPKLVSLMKRLALKKERILALPNPLAATVKSGRFAEAHNSRDPFQPFLPADLYAKDSSWICVGEDRHAIPASIHTGKLYCRSVFLQFMRLPGGRTATLEYMEKLKKRLEPFPVGTQFALIEQPFLIGTDGEMVLSPLIASVQLRAYLDVEKTAHAARPGATQCVTEFLMQPRKLMLGDAAMRALTSTDFRYEAGSPSAASFSPRDPFASGDISESMPTTSRLNLCMRCHGGEGGRTVRTRSFRTTRFFFTETTPQEIGKATSAQKKGDKSWKRLSELWRADSPTKRQPPVRAVRPRDNTVSTTSNAADPYDVLYDVLMTRDGPDGKAYGANESAPSIFRESRFPFDDKSFKKFNAALDAFAALPQKKIDAYSDIQRAWLQRHLWHVFDATIPDRWVDGRAGEIREYGGTHVGRRAAVRPKLATLIQRLALTKAQILALPDTQAATVKSRRYPRRHDRSDALKPFLAADLDSKDSSWICIGFDGQQPTPFHSHKLKFRSAFFTFMRLPGGRAETLKYMKGKTGRKHPFPVGTQFALVERALLISDEGEMILSPLTVSISQRAYLDVQRSFNHIRPGSKPTQSVAEFVAQPRKMMRGNAIMRALGRRDLRFEAGDVDIHNEAVDPFEPGGHVRGRSDNEILHRPRLALCMNCHRYPGSRGVNAGLGLSGVKESSPQEIVKAVVRLKRDDYSWTTLSKLWKAKAATTSKPSPVKAERPRENKNASTAQRSAATRGKPANATADPYDVLYNVIMTRYGPDGKAYATDESSPSIFRSSTFPFGDATYKKLTAALDAFAALPQEKIEAYSDIKRALMQRHLWHVFDATAPYMWRIPDPATGKPRQFVRSKRHSDRREAVRPQIASLIRRLALPKKRILALPDTRAVTLKSGRFARRHDPGDAFKPFLPADIYTKDSSWVCLGEAGQPIPAFDHSRKLVWRSAFLSFMRLPGGRSETLTYMKKRKAQREHVEQFPVGTQFAFIEQAFLISDEGEMILSPLIVSISLRAYLSVERSFHRKARSEPTQSVAEFVTQPRQLMQGNAVMKALGPRDIRFDAGDVGGIGEVIEPFEKSDGHQRSRRRNNILRVPRLNLCMNCHSSRGEEGVAGHGGLFGVQESSPEEIVKATLTRKRDDFTWKTLRKFWQANSKKGKQPPARAERPLNNKHVPKARRPAEPQIEPANARLQPTSLPADGDPLADPLTDPLPARAIRRFGTARYRHGENIIGMSVSPDDRFAVAFGRSLGSSHRIPSARIYDLRTGRRLAQLSGRARDIQGVAFSPDGKTIASKQRGGVRLHSPRTGIELDKIKVWLGNPLMVTYWLTFSKDGSKLAQSAGSKDVQIIDVTTKKLLHKLGHDWTVYAGAFSPDGKLLATGDRYSVRIWDVETGKQVRHLKSDPPRLNSLVFSPDGKTLAGGGHDDRLRLWDVASGKIGQIFITKGHFIRSVAFAHDGKTVAAAAGPNIWLFDLTTKKEWLRIRRQAHSLHFSPADDVLTAAVDGAIHRWDTKTGKLLTPEGCDSGVDQIDLIDNGRTLVTRDQAGVVQLWDQSTGRLIVRLQMEDRREVGVSPDGRYLVLSEDDRSIAFHDPKQLDLGVIHGNRLKLYDLKARRYVERFGGFKGDAQDKQISRDGKTMVTVDHRDGKVRIWDVATGKERRTCYVVRKNEVKKWYLLSDCLLSPDGKTMAVAHRRRNYPDGTADLAALRLWDIATGKELFQLAYPAKVHGLAFSPDGRLLVACSQSAPAARKTVRTCYVWDVKTGRRIVRLSDGESVAAYRVAFSPDGRTLASGSLDGTVCLWEVASWTPRLKFQAHRDHVTALQFAPDGTLFTGSFDGTVLSWNVRPEATDKDTPLATAWTGLLDHRAEIAHRAAGRMHATPQATVEFLAEHLRPAAAVDAKRIAKLLAELDSDDFATREAASRALFQVRHDIEAKLRETLAKTASTEVRTRVQALLSQLKPTVTPPAELRTLRAVEVLEQLATPSARTLLSKLAKGERNALLTRASAAATERLRARARN